MMTGAGQISRVCQDTSSGGPLTGLEARLHDIVSALVYSCAGASQGAFASHPVAPYNDLTRFILEQMTQLPDFLRHPLMAAAIGFDLLGLLRSARCFHSRSEKVRAAQIAAWRNSKSNFKRDFIRYFESLALFGLYSRNSDASLNVGPALFCAQGMGPGVIDDPANALRAEVVVIGSGPGGAITACLLAEAGREVLLVEEGGYYRVNSSVPFSLEEMLQKYRNGGQTVALGKNKIAYVEGRCVGGGSEINSGLYHRTPPEILDLWRREFQVEGLGEADLRQEFEACEKELSVSLAPGPAPGAAVKLIEGAKRLGWKFLEVPRWFRYDQAGPGVRQSMTETFIPRFLRSGGRLLPRTRVDRLRRAEDGWELEAKNVSGTALRIKAGTLFLCCGAIQTPALLRRSGITCNIGNTLRVHPTIKVVAEFSEPVNFAEMGVPTHQVKEFAPRLSFGCSVSTPAYLALGLAGNRRASEGLPENPAQMANYYAMITGEGHGTVRTLARYRDPLVRYHLSEKDRRDLADGLRKLSELLFEAGATRLWNSVPGYSALNREQLQGLPAALPNGAGSLMTIHLFSSCPMGEDRSKCAVNSFGRLHQFSNLFINDASVLCSPPGVNPQGTIMSIARRNVKHFLGQNRGKP